MRIDEQLREGVRVLEIIDRRRAETGDPAIGSAIERVIVDRCLADLEKQMDPATAEPIHEDELIFCRMKWKR